MLWMNDVSPNVSGGILLMEDWTESVSMLTMSSEDLWKLDSLTNCITNEEWLKNEVILKAQGYLGRRNGFVVYSSPLHENQALLLFKTSRICSRQTDHALLLLFLCSSYSARVDYAIKLSWLPDFGKTAIRTVNTLLFSICYDML